MLLRSESLILAAICLAALAGLCIGRKATRGWRIAVVVAAFLPALFVWACFLLAALLFLLIATGVLPVD